MWKLIATVSAAAALAIGAYGAAGAGNHAAALSGKQPTSATGRSAQSQTSASNHAADAAPRLGAVQSGAAPAPIPSKADRGAQKLQNAATTPTCGPGSAPPGVMRSDCAAP